MKLHLLPLAAAFVMLSSCADKCPVCTGGPSSGPVSEASQRTAVLKALRTGKEASFQVHRLNIKGDWAYADVTPLDKAGRPIAEGGPHVLQYVRAGCRAREGWTDLDLTKVPADPDDPLGAEDSSSGWVRNVQKTYSGVPREIFPKPSH